MATLIKQEDSSGLSQHPQKLLSLHRSIFLKGQSHEMVVDMGLWRSSLGIKFLFHVASRPGFFFAICQKKLGIEWSPKNV
jgi:hypothetical protein